jgi:hypothetical protein
LAGFASEESRRYGSPAKQGRPWKLVAFIRQYSQKALQPKPQSTSIVVWGINLTSTVNEKFTIKQLAMVQLATYQKSVIVGLILSDG